MVAYKYYTIIDWLGGVYLVLLTSLNHIDRERSLNHIDRERRSRSI